LRSGEPAAQARSTEAALLDVAHTVRTARNCIRLASDASQQGDRNRERRFNSAAEKLAIRLSVLEEELARSGVGPDDARLMVLYEAPVLDNDPINAASVDDSIAALVSRSDQIHAILVKSCSK
jgi:hypothetical protein